MKVELLFHELHNPLFLGEKNWGQKLYRKQAKGHLGLEYDRDEKELLVTHKDSKGTMHTAIVPTANVSSMTPMPEGKHPLELPAEAGVNTNGPKGKPGPKPKITAQVSGPHDHVFHQGPGKTRD